MTVLSDMTKCLYCNNPLPPNHKGVCPKCGGKGRAHKITIRETLSLSENLQTIREFYEKNPAIKGVIVLIIIISPLIGLLLANLIGALVGLTLGIISYFISPRATTKVREIWQKKQ